MSFARVLIILICGVLLTAPSPFLQAQEEDKPRMIPAPDRKAGEGEGPFERLIIRGATVIDGSGAPPIGPVDIVIEGNRIARLESVGYPGLEIDVEDRPGDATREIDAHGHYVLPGLVDMHVHTGGATKAPEAEYSYKLWMGHGITTTRGVPHSSLEFSLAEKARSARNEIVAPRMFAYHTLGSGEKYEDRDIRRPEEAREWVRYLAKEGADGLKLRAHRPAIMAALIDEAKKQGFGTTAHLDQMGVAQMNALDAARLGLQSMTHFYGLLEAMYEKNDVQPWPTDMNYNNEQHRFGQVARQWSLVRPGSAKWRALQTEFLELGFTLDPTFNIYSAGRDVMRARNADWHDEYTLPTQWDFYTPHRVSHGSYWFYWTTEDEVAWRNFYQVWMQFVNEYKNRGGRVTVGSDSGFIYQLFGFGTVLEMEMLQEAGFHPLEVIRAATMHGAQVLHEPKGQEIEFGVIREGLLADLLIVEENPLENLKVLYGTGAVKLNDETQKPERVGGVKYTIKDGIVYDAKQLLADVREMVAEQKSELGNLETY
ncbi:MAG: amidohydrolase family protein [Gammaproteobacteria bacterium]|nr:amidohydrolase family protein [Gammaproteobacteria bacterium]